MVETVYNRLEGEFHSLRLGENVASCEINSLLEEVMSARGRYILIAEKKVMVYVLEHDKPGVNYARVAEDVIKLWGKLGQLGGH